MSPGRDTVIDAVVYMDLVDLVEASAAAIVYSLRGLSLDAVDASLTRLADYGLVESMPDGRLWRVRATP